MLAGLLACQPDLKERPTIAVTIEPQRYFAEQLVDSLFDIMTIVPAGISPETYDPSPLQMAALSRSRAYFSIGPIGFNLLWLERIRSNNPQLPVFDNSKNIPLITAGKEQDTLAGHETRHCSHENGRSRPSGGWLAEGYSHYSGADPHIWSSPRSARIIVQNMYDALISIDAGNREIYKSKLLDLQAEIDRTDSILSALFVETETRSFIIYHPALTYLARDYGLVQYCIETEGKEPSPSYIRQLIETARVTKTGVIFIQEEFDRKNAEVIARETGCKLIVINPLSYNWSQELIRIAQAIHE